MSDERGEQQTLPYNSRQSHIRGKTRTEMSNRTIPLRKQTLYRDVGWYG